LDLKPLQSSQGTKPKDVGYILDPDEREKFRHEELQLNVLGIYDKYEA